MSGKSVLLMLGLTKGRTFMVFAISDGVHMKRLDRNVILSGGV